MFIISYKYTRIYTYVYQNLLQTVNPSFHVHVIYFFIGRYFEEDIAGDELLTEITSFQGLYKKSHPDTNAGCTVSALSVLKYMYDNRLHEIYPNLNIILRMFLTVPVTVASGERSFSKLKIIKNYLRSSMAQDRLTGLALISVEHDVGRTLDYSELIKEFAAQKARKVHFV